MNKEDTLIMIQILAAIKKAKDLQQSIKHTINDGFNKAFNQLK